MPQPKSDGAMTSLRVDASGNIGGYSTRANVSWTTPAAPPQIKDANGWFGPWQPLQPIAPPSIAGRQYDYPTGQNLNYIPRGDADVSFEQLRSLANSLPVLSTVITNRLDRIASWDWSIQPVERTKGARRRLKQTSTVSDARLDHVTAFFRRPDQRHDYHTWLRPILRDMLVIDAATMYPRYTYGGDLFSVEVVDGSTINPLIGLDGRAPLPDEGPAYQQILHGVVGADFTLDELLYLPRNPQSNSRFGRSPVEEIVLTVNIALRRELFNLNYYNEGTIPDGFATLPKDWSMDQIKQFQDYFDSLMSGDLAMRRKAKFVPADFTYHEVRQPPLKDLYDEWLTRIICFAFSVPFSPFGSQVNRATADNLQLQAENDGSIPVKSWIKSWMDRLIQSPMYLNEPNLEFAWVGDDAIDPLQQAQTLQILVAAGIKTRDEAREELGLDPLMAEAVAHDQNSAATAQGKPVAGETTSPVGTQPKSKTAASDDASAS